MQTLKKVCQERNFPIIMYSRKSIRSVFKQFNAHTKHEIAKTNTRRFPQYKWQLPRKRKLCRSECIKQGMFDATALVLTYYYLNP